MPFVMPVGTRFDGSSNIDSVTFAMADHSAADPHFVIVDRKAPVTKNGSTSMAQERFRVFENLTHPLTGEKRKKVTEINVRYPDWTPANGVDADIQFLATLAATAEFKDAVENLTLPYTSAV